MPWARISPQLTKLLLASAFAPSCDRATDRAADHAANAADATTPAPANTANTTSTAKPAEVPIPAQAQTPWHYAPALAAATPAGVHAEPVLELADGLRGQARIVVAVATGETPARLEVWAFSQNNERALLARTGEPEVLLDLGDVRGLLATDAVATLRREMAMPGRERVRPLGLPGEPPAVLAELARLATATTAATDAATRARSLALFMRGVDDELIWSRLPELLRRLQNAPWIPGEATPLGARRVAISATEEGRPVRLELARTQDRWALVTVETPTVDPR